VASATAIAPVARRPASALLLALLALAAAASARAATAPGRVSIGIGGPATRDGVDPFAATRAAGGPDRTIVTAGVDARAHDLLVTRLLPSGALDPAFGVGGLARVKAPVASDLYGPFPQQVLVAPDGSVVVVFQASPENGVGLARLRPDGRLDPGFGDSGIALTGLTLNGFAALGAEGSVYVLGDAGGATVKRFGPDGRVDGAFGAGKGQAYLGLTSPAGLAALPDGRLAALADAASNTARVTYLSADGAIGSTVDVPGEAFGLVAHDDGSLDASTIGWRVQRIDPSGALAGSVALPKSAGDLPSIVRGPGDTALATTPIRAEGNTDSGLIVTAIAADGTATRHVLRSGFGGGDATVPTHFGPPFLQPLGKGGLFAPVLAARSDGDLVLVGSSGVIQYTGEGEGYLHEEIAAAAFTPAFARDTSFGGPGSASLRLTVPAQRASTVANPRNYTLAVLANASAAGLCDMVVRARGAVVARALVPIFHAGLQRVHVTLTVRGRRLLRGVHAVPVAVSGTLEELVGLRARAAARGVLR